MVVRVEVFSNGQKSRYSILALLLASLAWCQFDLGRRSTFSMVMLERLVDIAEEGRPAQLVANSQQQAQSKHQNGLKFILEQQVKEQAKFQNIIYTLMHPSDCRTARALYQKRHDRKESGFTCLLHVISRVLLVALATQRTLVIASDWQSLYEPPNCTNLEPTGTLNGTQLQRSFYECLWEPISHCTDSDMVESNSSTTTTNVSLPAAVVGGWVKNETTLSVGILNMARSIYFDVMYYGPNRVVDAPSWPWELPNTRKIDVVLYWERRYGRFWIRAQLAHYMWRPNPSFQEQIAARMPRIPPDVPYIAFHVRYTDNIRNLARVFGRDATVTRQFQRFMDIAEHIRKEINPLINTIYLATDNAAIVKTSVQEGRNWTFVVQANVERTTSTTFFWYATGRSKAAAGMATDLEMLRRADFLVGSFQSNVYRLAAELNLVYLSDRYPWSMQRHYTVDVEWYEDP